MRYQAYQFSFQKDMFFSASVLEKTVPWFMDVEEAQIKKVS